MVIITDEMIETAQNAHREQAFEYGFYSMESMRAALEAVKADIKCDCIRKAEPQMATIDVIAKAREVIRPVSSVELLYDGHSDEWKLGFDVAAQAMAIEATRAVNVLADCIEDLAAALRVIHQKAKVYHVTKEIDGIARAPLMRWGLRDETGTCPPES